MDNEIKYKSFPELIKYGELRNAYNRMERYDGVPSVTSVLSILQYPEALKQYRAFSETRFNNMMKQAGTRGTDIHKHIEKTYKTGTISLPNSSRGAGFLEFYTKIGSNWKPIELEIIVKNKLIGGTIDAIMDIDGVLTIIDWKSYGQRLNPGQMFKYKLQLAKYTQLYQEQTSKQIEQGKIVAFSKNGKYNIIDYSKEELYDNVFIYDYIFNKFTEYMDRYKERINS